MGITSKQNETTTNILASVQFKSVFESNFRDFRKPIMNKESENENYLTVTTNDAEKDWITTNNAVKDWITTNNAEKDWIKSNTNDENDWIKLNNDEKDWIKLNVGGMKIPISIFGDKQFEIFFNILEV